MKHLKYFLLSGMIMFTLILVGASCVPQSSTNQDSQQPNEGVSSTQPGDNTGVDNQEIDNSSNSTMLPCNSNEQCIPGKLCVNRECVPAEEVLPSDPTTGELLCNSNAQCWNGKVCIDSHCVERSTTCSTDGDCGDIRTFGCVDNVCIAFPPNNLGCNSNAQCVSGKLCSNGTCVPAEQVLPKDPVTGELLCNSNAQCWNGKVCIDSHCVVPTNSPSTDKLTCSADSQCSTGQACFQGRCTQVPSSCNFHTECLSDDYVCSNGQCVWPGPSGHTCQNTYGERWHCLNSQTCGKTENECL